MIVKKLLVVLFAILFLAQKSLAQSHGCYFDEASKKFGLADPETAEPMTGPIFDHASHLEGTDSLAVAKTAAGFGIFSSKTGREIVAPRFSNIEFDRLGYGKLGFAQVFLDGAAGLVRLSDGKLIVPTEFEACGAFSKYAPFGRRKGSDKIEKFNENGLKMGEIDGVLVHPTDFENLWKIWKRDGSWVLVDETGDVFGIKAIGAERLRLFQTLTKNGEPESAFLLSAKRDTLVKNALEIRQISHQKFIVALKNKPAPRWGLCDETGKWLIEPTKKSIRPLGHPKAFSNVVVAEDERGFEQVWSKNGQLLIDSCRVQPLLIHREIVVRAKNSAAPLYFTAEKSSQKGTLGLFKLDGTPVLPMEFSGIFGATERHFFIGSKKRPIGGQTFDAYDKKGEKVFDGDFDSMRFTDDPTAFWALKNGSWALVDERTFQREPPVFKVADVRQLPSGCFEIYEKGRRKLTDPSGRTVLAIDLDYPKPPTRRQFERFFEKTGRRGQLVAVDVRRRDPEGAFWAIDRSGERIFFESQTPKKEAVEVLGNPTDAVILEKMPNEPAAKPPVPELTDEIFEFVEKRPQFPGGEAALLAFLNQNLKYPALAKENAIAGKVVVQFTVEKDGSLTDLKVLRDIGGDCGKEAVRLVGLMPKWEPGRQNGQSVRVQYMLPVQFHLY